MSAWLPYAYWPLAALLMAAGQGLLLPAIRRTPPGPEARRQAFALHEVLLLAYFLPLVLVPSPLGVGLGVGCRLLLFDPVLNLAAGCPVFEVGSAAASDRALRWVATRLRVGPDKLRAGVWVGSAIIAVIYLVFK